MIWNWLGRKRGRKGARPARPVLRCEALEERLQPSVFDFFALGVGEGGFPRVQVFDARSGGKVADFAPFEPSFRGGVTVAMGQVNGDLFPDLIVGAGPGGGPRVRVFDGGAILAQGPDFRADTPGAVIADFFAFESTQRGGVFVASGNFIGADAFEEVVVGAGPGGGPRVRVLDGQQVTLKGLTFTSFGLNDTVADFFAFEPTFRNGVTVAATPRTTGSTGIFSNLVVGPGFGGGPRVRVLDGLVIAGQRTLYSSFRPGDAVADFFAYDPALRTGLFVAGADFDSDGLAEVVTGPGPGTDPLVVAFSGRAIAAQRAAFTGFFQGDRFDQFLATDSPGYANGVTVGSSLVNGQGDLLLYGFGAPGLTGRALADRYTFSFGFGVPVRQRVFDIPFDPGFQGRVNVSN
ncbi:MAG TPA: hypothetical protein VIL46_03580 [Gemmataceae bacterium]